MFDQLKLGYTTTTPEVVLQSFLEYFRRNDSQILPGEGARILSLMEDVILYLGQIKSATYAAANVTTTVFLIIDQILSLPNSLNKASEIRTLLETIQNHMSKIGMALKLERNILLTLNTIHVTFTNLSYSKNYYFHIPDDHQTVSRTEDWWSVQISGTNNLSHLLQSPRAVGGIIFRNLSAFLPPRSFLRMKDGSELEYELYSQIITIVPIPNFLDIYPIAIDFKHELHNNLNWSDDETWTVKCGYANLSIFTYSWDIDSCYTKTLNDMKTRCICPKSGIFALLLTLMPPNPVTEDSNSKRVILIIGCSFCMVLALFTTACLATSCWLLKKSCLMALKLQCSMSVFGTGLLFTLATITEPPQSYFMVFVTTLETFFLLGMSSHLSKLLIVFTELIQMPKPMTSKYTVIGIISGVPIITVFGSHLSYRTMNIKLESWWMLKGTLAFYIFVVVTSIICILFIFLYVIVMRKLSELIVIHEKYTKSIEKRVALLRRSGYIFSTVTLFSISSIVYINYPNKLWSIYQFSIYNVFSGIILLFCYVLKAETQFRYMFKNKSKIKSDDKFFSFDSTSSPLNFLTRQDPEVENESRPPMQPICQQFNMDTNSSKPQSVTSTFENGRHTNTSFCENHTDGIPTSHLEKPYAKLECYNNSPQSFKKYSSMNPCSRSPDILSSKVCVELDLVASSLPSTNKIISINNEPRRRVIFPPKVVITPDDAIAKILETETVITQSCDRSKSDYERTQPDGHDEEMPLEIVTEEDEETECTEKTRSVSDINCEEKLGISTDKLDGMLDSISHDLDFLLNRGGVDSVVQVSTLRRVSKPPGASVKNQIPEELLTDENTTIPESVTLRTNC